MNGHRTHRTHRTHPAHRSALRLTLVGFALLATLPGLSYARGGGGGGGDLPPATGILPTTPPAPDVIYRESFGAADLIRPAGGKGLGRETYTHTNLNGFWIEYPGSKDTSWKTPEGTQTWRLAGCSDNLNEMPSPLQLSYGNGCISSEWFDPVTSHPTALMPFRAPNQAYEVSMDGWPAPIPGGYIAIGLTQSSLLASNLETSASVWLVVYPPVGLGYGIDRFELRTAGLSGELLASGDAGYPGLTPFALTYDPIAETVSATLDGVTYGPYPLAIPTPRYVGFEGVGVLDNFVVRLLP